MKILVVNWRCIRNPEAGGAEVHLHEIFRRVAAAGHRVTLVSHAFPGSLSEETIDGIRILRTGNKYLFDRQFRKFYLRTLADQPFDLVVDDISKIPLNMKAYVRSPLVGIIHHLHGPTLYKELPWPMALYIHGREKAIPRNYKDVRIFAVSPSTKKELTELGAEPDSIDLLYNGIDRELLSCPPVSKTDAPTLLYFGRIKRYKRIDQIIDALPPLLREFPSLTLTIAGDGDDRPRLEKIVRESGLASSVRFTGAIPESGKRELLGSAWLSLTTSEKEGWGITVIESNACGTPVVAYDVPGLRDSIDQHRTGVLVPDGDRTALVSTVAGLLHEPSRLSSLSEAARAHAARYTWEKSAEHFITKIREWYPALR